MIELIHDPLGHDLHGGIISQRFRAHEPQCCAQDWRFRQVDLGQLIQSISCGATMRPSITTRWTWR
ncbi:MAG: hypothetical protein AAGI01_02730 [Myxococcota bacterium]